MYGGLALRKNLLIVGYSDVQGTLRAYDLQGRRLIRTIALERIDGELTDLGGVCIDEAMCIYAVDSHGHFVRKVNLFGREVLRFGGPSHAIRRHLDRRRTLQHPNAVAVDEEGLIYLACGDRPLVHGLQIYDRNGRYAGRFAAFGEERECFGAPRGLSLTSRRVYVADTMNSCVQIFSREGRFISMLSSASAPGERSRPTAVLSMPDGGLLVAQGGDHSAVKEFDREGRFVRWIATRQGEGKAARAGNLPAPVCDPCGLALDESGRLYVGDELGQRVQVCDLGASLYEVFEGRDPADLARDGR